MYYKSLKMPKKYTKVKVIRITDIQHETLIKMSNYNVNVGNFIRDAISEKIKREYKDIVKPIKEIDCPF